MKQKPAETKRFQVGKIWLGTGRAVVRMGNAECKGNHQPEEMKKYATNTYVSDVSPTPRRLKLKNRVSPVTMANIIQRSNIVTVNISFTCRWKYCVDISVTESLRMGTLPLHNVPRTLKVLFTAVKNVFLRSKDFLTVH